MRNAHLCKTSLISIQPYGGGHGVCPSVGGKVAPLVYGIIFWNYFTKLWKILISDDPHNLDFVISRVQISYSENDQTILQADLGYILIS